MSILNNIKNNNPQSAYAKHINRRHQSGAMQDTVNRIMTTQQGTRMNCWESYSI